MPGAPGAREGGATSTEATYLKRSPYDSTAAKPRVASFARSSALFCCCALSQPNTPPPPLAGTAGTAPAPLLLPSGTGAGCSAPCPLLLSGAGMAAEEEDAGGGGGASSERRRAGPVR